MAAAIANQNMSDVSASRAQNQLATADNWTTIVAITKPMTKSHPRHSRRSPFASTSSFHPTIHESSRIMRSRLPPNAVEALGLWALVEN